jgi:ABC-type uncharacterized transport system permease subunit
MRMMEIVAMATVVAMVAGLVLYPIYYLFQAALDVGLPDTRPPTAYGIDNFAKLLDYPTVLWNTLVVTCVATLLALVFGFISAWILTRTNVPFKRTLDQLMTLPYYVTPLLGALAWSLLGAPESGFINQVWRKFFGTEALIDITSPMGIAWVMALFEGSVAYVMISAVMQSMDPALEEAFGRSWAGAAGEQCGGSRCRWWRRACLGGDLRVRRDAGFVLRRARARHARALLRDHHGHLSFRVAVSTPHCACRGHGSFVVRRDVRDALALPLADVAQQLRDGKRQGVPAACHRHGTAALGAIWRGGPLCAGLGHPAGGDAVLRSPAKACSRLPGGIQFHARPLPAGIFHQRLFVRPCSTASCWPSITATLGVMMTGLLSWIICAADCRAWGSGISCHVPAGRAAHRVRVRHDVGLAGFPPCRCTGTFWVLLIAYLTVFMPLRRAHHLGRRTATR